MSSDAPLRPLPVPGWLLAFDASTPRCVIALGRADGTAPRLVVGDDDDDAPNQASTRLVPRIEQALARAGIEARDLGAVACGRGPGTFTGTRVAVATAKGIAYAVGCPTVAVSTLAAVAASTDHEGTVLAILDARRDEVYGGLFHGRRAPASAIEAIGDERVSGLAAWLASITPRPSRLLVAGSGVEPYRAALVEAGLADDARPLPGPSAAGLWLASLAAWRRAEATHPAALDAVYLRASYAEMGIHPPKHPFVKSPFV